nr:hypothetical protein [Tanacetum cinerariifolium]
MDLLDAVESCGFCDATFEDKNSLITHIKLTHDRVEQQDGNQFVNDDIVTCADVGAAAGGIHLTRERDVYDGIAALTSWLKQQLLSDVREIAGPDHESLRRANFANLTSAALELSRQVDLQIDPSAKRDYITSSTDWLKRSLKTMRPSTVRFLLSF